MLNATPLLSVYANRRFSKISSMDQVAEQERQLLRLVGKASETQFGQEHNFSAIQNVRDFQNQVPLRSYEEFWQSYWKPSFPKLNNCTWPGTIPFFPVSSGTTSGTTKYIPCSREMLKSNTKAALDILVHHLNSNPKSQVFGGKSFVLGGSTELVEEAPGIFSGDLSGIVNSTIPWWAKSRYFPNQDLALIKDWEEKIDIFARQALQEDIRMISGVPSWMLILFEKLFELTPSCEELLVRIFPKLELIVHGGVNFASYHDRFMRYLQGSKAELREVYPASEGFIAVADRGYNEGLRLINDHGIFYEFVPLEELNSSNPTRHWLSNIETDVNYAIVLTTCAGLWSYVIGDTIKFIEREPARLLVTGRTSYMLSAFGEHVIAEEVEDAISQASRKIEKSITDYSVGAVFPEKSGELGGHIFVIEFEDKIPQKDELEIFSSEVDKRLIERNEDYAAHRAGGFGLRDPEFILVKSGTFAEWMKSRGKLGGQNKVPRIINDQTLFNNLLSFAKK